MNYTISQQTSHLAVTVSGMFDPEAGRRCIEDMYAAAKQSGLLKVLIDGRGLEANVSIADRHALATYLADLHDIPVRCAVLVPTALMTTKTLEHTAGNRGTPVRTTDSVTDACVWLGVPVID
ncbi:MAG: hypothetical protein JNM76_00800 [Betaproteobacteria bacterium]|nr:hypothetical protein [Betaproteobacteria bacterium]